MLSNKLYIHNDTIYQGELSDIETLLALNSGYGFVPNIIEAKVVHVTPDALIEVKELYQEIETKMEELKNLRSKLYELSDLKLLPR